MNFYRSNHKLWILLCIVIAILILVIIIAAPSNNQLLAGSTFGKSPNGYGAWYQYMLKQEVVIERWQKPFSQLKPTENPISFLKILPPEIEKFYRLSTAEKEWIERGNTMVVLGVDAPATAANFTTTQSYKELNIKIATTRRKQLVTQSILEDDYGSIVWQENIGKGTIIYAVTPYIAANAYQNNLNNYQFLAELVRQNSLVLVDEYLHGYKAQEVIQQESQSKQETILSYLSKTIWLPIAFQVGIILIIRFLSSLRRFGQLTIKHKTQIDNSQAYIQALAGILEKAECSDFVVTTITKDEKLQLQKSLGLGTNSISDELFLNRWEQATGKNSKKLQNLLQFARNKSRFNYSELNKWLQQWQKLHH